MKQKARIDKLAVVLRQAEQPNFFRKVILGCFKEQELPDVTICSGFFQQRGSYFASNCFKEVANLPNCCLPTRKLTVVGVYNGLWKKDFENFVTEMKKVQCHCGAELEVSKRLVKRYGWHAKIFIASDSEGPQLGVIGSSNITSRAFGPLNKSLKLTKWNYEADVVMWSGQSESAIRVMERVFEEISNETSNQILVSHYNPEDRQNRGATIQMRLDRLLGELNSIATFEE